MHWLSVKEISLLDTAYCSQDQRLSFCAIVHSICQIYAPIQTERRMIWFILGGIKNCTANLDLIDHKSELGKTKEIWWSNKNLFLSIRGRSGFRKFSFPFEFTNLRSISLKDCEIKEFPFIKWEEIEVLSIDNCQEEVTNSRRLIDRLEYSVCLKHLMIKNMKHFKGFDGIRVSNQLISLKIENATIFCKFYDALFHGCTALEQVYFKHCGMHLSSVIMLLKSSWKKVRKFYFDGVGDSHHFDSVLFHGRLITDLTLSCLIVPNTHLTADEKRDVMYYHQNNVQTNRYCSLEHVTILKQDKFWDTERTTSLVASIIIQSPNLKTFSTVNNLNDSHLELISESCRNITSIKASNQRLSDKTIDKLTLCCVGLTKLSLIACTGLAESS